MQTMKAAVKRYNDTHAGDVPRTITTGHSLGGVLAIVAAEDYLPQAADLHLCCTPQW
jgi:esterase/lipase